MDDEESGILDDGVSPDTEKHFPNDKDVVPCSDLDAGLKDRPAGAYTDRGWAWLVLLGSFASFVAIGFIMMTFSVLYVEFAEISHGNLGAIGWIGSVLIGCMHIPAFMYNAFIQHCGCRVVAITGSLMAVSGLVLSSLVPSLTYLYLTYGIITGVGTGMIFLPAAIVIQLYFDRYRGLATGIAMSGMSVGSLIAGPLTQLLLDRYGWRGTLVVIGGIFLHICAAGALYRPLSSPRPERNVDKGHPCRAALNIMADFSLFKDPRYLLYWLATFFLNIGLFTQYQHVINRAVHFGVDIHLAAFLPTVYGAVCIVASVAFGGVSNMKCANRVLQYGVGIFLGGVVVLFTVLATNYITMFVAYALYSVTCGMIFSSQYPALVDLFGLSQIARAQALLSLSFGLGGLLGVPFAGFLYDVTQSYDYTYYIAGGIQVAGGVLVLCIHLLKRNSSEAIGSIRV